MAVKKNKQALGKMSARAKTQAFILRHLRAWELTMAGLALLSVAVGVSASQLGEPDALVNMEWALTGVFALEYGVRLWAAPSRVKYFKSAIVDLISILPPVRGARLLRLLRLLRVASALNLALGTTRLGAQSLTILRIAVIWVAVVVISAFGMYLAEFGENPNVRTFWDALWWAVVTITTVGYGDVSPATAEGRLAAGVLMVLGIAFFSFLTATFTSALASNPGAPPASLEKRLTELRTLQKKNLISVTEYARLRKQLLDR
jgi:voltage-gated potassium channel